MLLAVLRDVADPRVVGLVRVGLGEVQVAERHLARDDLAHPGEGLDELALAVALDAGHADDLAGPHLEGEAVDGGQVAVVLDVQVGDLQDGSAGVASALSIESTTSRPTIIVASSLASVSLVSTSPTTAPWRST